MRLAGPFGPYRTSVTLHDGRRLPAADIHQVALGAALRDPGVRRPVSAHMRMELDADGFAALHTDPVCGRVAERAALGKPQFGTVGVPKFVAFPQVGGERNCGLVTEGD